MHEPVVRQHFAENFDPHEGQAPEKRQMPARRSVPAAAPFPFAASIALPSASVNPAKSYPPNRSYRKLDTVFGTFWRCGGSLRQPPARQERRGLPMRRLFSITQFGALLEHHTAQHAYCENIKPAVVRIEQMRMHSRGDDILDHNHGAKPSGNALAAEQQEMRDPHRPQHKRAHKAELDSNRKSLIVRIDRSLRRNSYFAGRDLTKFLRYRAGTMTQYGCCDYDRERLFRNAICSAVGDALSVAR